MYNVLYFFRTIQKQNEKEMKRKKGYSPLCGPVLASAQTKLYINDMHLHASFKKENLVTLTQVPFVYKFKEI